MYHDILEQAAGSSVPVTMLTCRQPDEGKSQVTLMVGQLCFGREIFSKRTNVAWSPKQTTWDWVTFLFTFSHGIELQ